MLVMVVMAGRVIPAFTANGTGTKKVLPNIWIERLSLATPGLLLLLQVSGVIQYLSSIAIASLFFILRAYYIYYV